MNKTCSCCNHWNNVWFDNHGKRVGSCYVLTDREDGCRVYEDSIPIQTDASFACIYHESNVTGEPKETPPPCSEEQNAPSN